MSISVQGKNVGVFQKDAFTGEFVDAWKSTMASVKIAQVSLRRSNMYMLLSVGLGRMYKILFNPGLVLCVTGQV